MSSVCTNYGSYSHSWRAKLASSLPRGRPPPPTDSNATNSYVLLAIRFENIGTFWQRIYMIKDLFGSDTLHHVIMIVFVCLSHDLHALCELL